MSIRAASALVILALAAAGCASSGPAGSYFPSPKDPSTVRVADALRRAAVASGDDPARYSFGFISTPVAAAYSDEDGTFYVTDGLLRLPEPVLHAMLAHEVAHEVLGHMGTRRALALTLSAGFGAGGMLVPGVGLVDFLASPLAVRAFSRRQEMIADQKAVEILWDMGYRAPRRVLAESIVAVARARPKPKEGLGGLLDSHPSLDERLAALEPIEPGPPTSAANRPPTSPK